MSTLTLTLVQSSLFWEDKKANLQMLEQKIRGLQEKTEILILPEMFSTGFSMQPALLAETMSGPTVSWMKRLAAELKIILTGSVIIEEGGMYYNRLIWVLPNGQLGTYDKRHLFAYGEEDRHYRAGHKRLVASVKGWKILLLVCYDLRFPVWSRQQSGPEGPEYDLLVYVANWPERRSHAWKTLLPARAIENQCYVAAVNRTGLDGNQIAHSGDSMILSPLGETLVAAGSEETLLTFTLDRDSLADTRHRFPFWKSGDYFKILTDE